MTEQKKYTKIRISKDVEDRLREYCIQHDLRLVNVVDAVVDEFIIDRLGALPPSGEMEPQPSDIIRPKVVLDVSEQYLNRAEKLFVKNHNTTLGVVIRRTIERIVEEATEPYKGFSVRIVSNANPNRSLFGEKMWDVHVELMDWVKSEVDKGRTDFSEAIDPENALARHISNKVIAPIWWEGGSTAFFLTQPDGEEFRLGISNYRNDDDEFFGSLQESPGTAVIPENHPRMQRLKRLQSHGVIPENACLACGGSGMVLAGRGVRGGEVCIGCKGTGKDITNEA